MNAIPLKELIHILVRVLKQNLNEINEIKYYISSEIQEKKTMSKKVSKYIAPFDYFGKTLIVLKALIFSK